MGLSKPEREGGREKLNYFNCSSLKMRYNWVMGSPVGLGKSDHHLYITLMVERQPVKFLLIPEPLFLCLIPKSVSFLMKTVRQNESQEKERQDVSGDFEL